MDENWMSCKYPNYMIEEADKLSKILNISRSELLRNALDIYINRHSPFLRFVKIKFNRFLFVLNLLSKKELKVSFSFRWKII